MVWTLPKTWNVGDVMTSTDMNTYVRDNSNFLYGDTSSALATFTSGYANFGGGYNPLSFRKLGNYVVFGGLVINNTGVAVNPVVTFATIPAGYTPPGNFMLTADVGGSLSVGRLDINSSGAISYSTGPSWGNGSYFNIAPSIYSLS